tara:strand:+ start:89 stop:199 length:111 start_codon:yes stop_codon:yes gene_type:complete
MLITNPEAYGEDWKQVFLDVSRNYWERRFFRYGRNT